MKPSLDARASYSGYIALCTIWVLLGFLGVYIIVARHNMAGTFPAVLSFGVAGLFALWLSGFRLIIENDRFRYRDGFFRWRECDLSEIVKAQAAWIEWDVGTKVIKIPRLVIEIEGREKILINAKPFTREALKRLNEILRPYRAKPRD